MAPLIKDMSYTQIVFVERKKTTQNVRQRNSDFNMKSDAGGHAASFCWNQIRQNHMLWLEACPRERGLQGCVVASATLLTNTAVRGE